jgi:hypothetical protein
VIELDEQSHVGELNKFLDSHNFLPYIMTEVQGSPPDDTAFHATSYDMLREHASVDCASEYSIDCQEALYCAMERKFIVPNMKFSDLVAISKYVSGTAIVGIEIMSQLISDQSLFQQLDPTPKHIDLLRGKFAVLNKVQILTDAYRQPEHKVIDPVAIMFIPDENRKATLYHDTKAYVGVTGDIVRLVHYHGVAKYVPRDNTKWQHTSGSVYEVITVANMNATKPEYVRTVVYRDQDQNVWTRPLSDWHRSFKEIQ